MRSFWRGCFELISIDMAIPVQLSTQERAARRTNGNDAGNLCIEVKIRRKLRQKRSKTIVDCDDIDEDCRCQLEGVS